ncbi:MAG: Flp pilus assembly complex ATPase component TadA [Candidatus Aenigmarchaeota archaeon]|nr:Flp pilus assembly complex ATPase component TadA [Candidatus Aenigmarchaeota archaeon]
MEVKSRAKLMAEILKKQTGHADSYIQEQKEKPKEKFMLRGYLYRKLIKPVEQLTALGRAGQMLNLQKKEAAVFPKFVIYPSKSLSHLSPKDSVKSKSMMYPLIKPYSYANIKINIADDSMLYTVLEPQLTEREKKIFEKLKEGLMQIIDISLDDINEQEKMMDYLEKNVRNLIEEYGFAVNDKEYLKIMYFISRDFVGLNEIEPLLNDPYIEDIGCDGTAVPIYVVHQRYGSIRTNIMFKDEIYLKDFVTKLAERCDRYISYAEPLLDGTLPSGSRVQASLAADVTTKGPTFSIRKFRESPFTPADMINFNTASVDMLAYLWFAVEHGANILIAGGVATGKTSFLNTLSMFIDDEAKIVSIEDTRELSLPHENWIPGVARVGFSGSNVGEISMFDLLKESFRQNPDYLIVGEIRGKEAYVMFQAMASGHPSIATIHAGSMDDVMKRLSTEPINISPGLLDVLDIVVVMIHARDKGKSARRVKEIAELESVDAVTGRPRVSKSFVWLPSEDSFEYRGNSWILHKISSERGIPINSILGDISRRKVLIKWMADRNINDMKEASRYLLLYKQDPQKLAQIIGERLDKEDKSGNPGF